MRKLLFAFPAVALAAVAMLGLGGGQRADAQASTVTIAAGGGEPGYSVNQFLPRTITVTTGTTVTWQFPWYEPHVIAFVAQGVEPPEDAAPDPSGSEWPNAKGYLVSSDMFGNPANPPTYSVKFTAAGSFAYFCPIHPLMTATVNVVASGDTDTQAELDARRASEYATNIAAIKAVAQQQSSKGGKITPRADGTNLFEVLVGGSDAAGNDAMQFFPANASIKTGDTIRWTTDNFTPHTVTFNFPPGPPQGDPFAIPRTADTTFSGQTTLVHSGIIWLLADQVPETYASYELTFTKAGTYQYVCILHAPQGMVGTVTVAQAAAPTASPTATTAPRPPQTGSGAGSEDDTAWMLVLGAAVAFLAGSAVFAAATRRNR